MYEYAYLPLDEWRPEPLPEFEENMSEEAEEPEKSIVIIDMV